MIGVNILMKFDKQKSCLLAGLFCLTLGSSWLIGVNNVRASERSVVNTTDNAKRVIDFNQTVRSDNNSVASEPVKADMAVTSINNVRLEWQEVPSAVRYQVVILKSAEDTPENIVLTADQVYTNGIDVDLSRFGSSTGSFFWKYCPLDYNGQVLGNYHFSKPQPITSGSSVNPKAPKPTTQYERMDYMPVYPVYSWIPMAGAKNHEVQVYKANSWGDSLIRTISAGEYDVYEDGGYTTPGNYYWRVRSLDAAGNPISDWSEKSYFSVSTQNTPIAALGDSITHGGGAMSVPPGYLLYDWESYSAVPIKNLGFSGNTTEAMLERFERDVLPFSPRVLVIMGGVNDYRGTVNGWTTVQNLKAIKEKCDIYGIIPVFLTVTPINPTLMVKRAHIEQPPFDWLVHQQYINAWIMKQQYHVDVAAMLADDTGWLRSNYTTDGLHPDYFGKKYIGEQVGKYLQEHFPWITNKLTKKPIPVYGK